jgi:hypothetical protein
MHLALTAEQGQLKDRLRSYFAGLVARSRSVDSDEPAYTGLRPADGGGRVAGPGLAGRVRRPGPGPIDQMIFVEESHWAGVPLPLLTLNSVGPTLMAWAPTSRRSGSSRGSCGARSTSPSATPSPRPAPIWRRSRPGRSGTGTST